jgi:hypothetical protein
MNKRIKVGIHFTFFIILLSTLVISLAWFDYTKSYPSQINASSKVNYFAKGTGTSLDPFIISKPEHMFNLSKLQELGYLQDLNYHFKVANPTTGEAITIEFNDPSLPASYRLFSPIGDATYPFIGIFNGNNSVLKSIEIDGSTKQDIGVFGYVGPSSSISDLFIDNPVIFSNPNYTDNQTGFHGHNEDIINRATGYIVGHLAAGAILERVYVLSPKISSLLNNDLNRSQYGLIGFNEADAGLISGGPRSSYNFTMNANSAYTQINNARIAYSNYFINGSGTLKIPSALNLTAQNAVQIIGNSLNVNTPINYSLSSLKISLTANDPNPMYLYDKMVQDGYAITSNNAAYNRENIDFVGLVNISGSVGSRVFNFSVSNKQSITPLVNSTFISTDYPATAILFVKPTGNPDNLGRIYGVYAGGGNLAYYRGFNTSGTYLPNTVPTTVSFGNSGVWNTMTTTNAFAAVERLTDGSLRVINPSTSIPDYYVFLIGLTNGQSTVSEITFEYTPAQLSTSSLTSIKDVDVINHVNDVLGLPVGTTYMYSYLNFGYYINRFQRLEVITTRAADGSFDIYISPSFLDTSSFYFDIVNIQKRTVRVYRGTTLIHSSALQVIEITFTPTTQNITAYDTSG